MKNIIALIWIYFIPLGGIALVAKLFLTGDLFYFWFAIAVWIIWAVSAPTVVRYIYNRNKNEDEL